MESECKTICAQKTRSVVEPRDLGDLTLCRYCKGLYAALYRFPKLKGEILRAIRWVVGGARRQICNIA